MREILFRGKRTDNGKWIEGSLVVAGDYCCILPADENSVHPTEYPYLNSETGTIDGHLIPVDPSTVGQYVSGLIDKNGKKIFEGDIILRRYVRPYFLVEYSEEDTEYQANFFDGSCASLYKYFSSKESKVIGNIHDNPELLEDKP